MKSNKLRHADDVPKSRLRVPAESRLGDSLADQRDHIFIGPCFQPDADLSWWLNG